jgi:DNA-binding MarR family transcriptional regulator
MWDPGSVTDRTEILAALQRNITTMVRRTVVPRAHERIITRAGVDIDRVEAVALSRISDAGSMRVTELADQLGVACSTAGRHAVNLEEGGLVGRSPDPDDRRVTVVTVTERGVELIERLRTVQRSMLAEALFGWTTEDLSTLAGLLNRLGEDLLALGHPMETRA